jgi:CheY-like chemotaxis protein
MPKILIVEDRKPDRDYLKVVLGSKGYTVVEASDGAEALDTVSATQPDLVITDALMPTMDGFEFVKRMRELSGVSDTPVIFYSAMFNERETRALAQQAGITAVLLKPSSAQEILAKVDELLTQGRRVVGEPTRTDFDERHAQVVGDKLLMKIGELEATEQRLAAVVTLFHRFTSELDPLVVLQEACSAARDVTMAQSSLIGVVSDEGTRVVHLLTCGMPAGSAGAMDRAVLKGPLLGPILEGRTPVRRTNPGGRPDALGLPSTNPLVHSYFGVPIASATRVYGWLELRNKLGSNEFTPGDEQIAIMIATQAGVAYENARVVEDLRRDTDRLRKTDERTRFALEAARLGIWDMDYTTGTLQWSRVLEQQYGLLPGTFSGRFEEFIDRTHPDDRTSMRETIGKAMKSGGDFTVENRAVWPDGTVRWLSAAGHIDLDAHGEPLRGIGITRDVSAGKTLDLELRQALRRLAPAE